MGRVSFLTVLSTLAALVLVDHRVAGASMTTTTTIPSLLYEPQLSAFFSQPLRAAVTLPAVPECNVTRNATSDSIIQSFNVQQSALFLLPLTVDEGVLQNKSFYPQGVCSAFASFLNALPLGLKATVVVYPQTPVSDVFTTSYATLSSCGVPFASIASVIFLTHNIPEPNRTSSEWLRAGVSILLTQQVTVSGDARADALALSGAYWNAARAYAACPLYGLEHTTIWNSTVTCVESDSDLLDMCSPENANQLLESLHIFTFESPSCSRGFETSSLWLALCSSLALLGLLGYVLPFFS